MITAALRCFRQSMAIGAMAVTLLCFSQDARAALSATPAKGVDLSGTWRLNAALSDNPKLIAEEVRSEMRDRSMRHRRPVDSDELDVSDVAGWRNDLPDDLKESLDTPAQLTLEQSPAGLSVKAGERTTKYSAGSKSVISYERGIAERTTGWKGRAFVIAMRAVDGEKREERYSIDSAGRLVLFKQTSGGDLPGIKIKYIYERMSVPEH